jgi:beta-lactamase class D
VRLPLLLFVLVTFTAGCTAPDAGPDAAPAEPVATDTARADWGRFFAAEDARGTIIVLDTRTAQQHVYDPARAAERFIPASTFKVYNSLVALDTGAAPDVDSVFAWDGVDRSISGWNRDHSIRTGIAASAVWLYQELARRIGEDGYRAAFAREPFGNGDPGGGIDRFWLDGALRISAEEQVTFLDRLRRGDLAFRPEHQAAVREVLLLEEGDGFRLFGKTGWAFPDAPEEIGWFVGWVEREDGAWVFALNIEAVGPGLDMMTARRAITGAVLADLGLRPAGGRP